MKDSYVALHCHSTYSFMDAVGTIEEWVKGAKAKGLAGLAITDHGDASSMLELYDLGKKYQFPVILGCEFYISMDNVKDKDDKYSHIVIWAKNQEGYRNICRLTYLSYQDENFYYKPRITFDNLIKNKEGLVIGSGCVNGVIAKHIEKLEDVDNPEVRHNLESLKNVFGDDLYLEVQYGDLTYDWDDKNQRFVRSSTINRQAIVNKVMRELGRIYGLKIIATPDAHMIDKDQKIVQDIQLKNYYKDKRCYYEVFYLPTRSEFFNVLSEKHSYFSEDEVDSYLDNTYEVMEKCKGVDLSFGYNLPKFDAIDVHELIKDMAVNIDWDNPTYKKRLDDELKVIRDNGVIDLLPYFLVLWDLVKWCEKNGVMVGPGRGSAAGCLLNYALGITKVDPIKYNLPFSRFLNSARVKKGTLPDIDLDFSNQQVAKDYLIKKYGREHVFNICVNQTHKAKLAFKDVLRAMLPELPSDKANELSKEIFHSPESEQKQLFKVSVTESEKLKGFLKDKKEVFKAVLKLIGQVRQRGTHAAAVVMSSLPIFDIVPVAKNRNDGDYVTQYTMKWCEKAGLIKYDILGLKTLKDIYDCSNLISAIHGKKINVFDLKFKDKEVFKIFERCETDTVFQFNTDLVKRILSKVKINSLEDLSIITSIARPGPMDMGMHETFISRVNGDENIVYPHPSLENVLKDTYGIMCYQEQVMEAVKILGGFTDEEADDVRRAMGKKKVELLDKAKDKFIEYATKNYSDINNQKAQGLWDLIYSFAGYGFCHAHAIAYSMIAYACAWMKKDYPLQWWASVLNNEGDADLVKEYYMSNRQMFVLPDINKSKTSYSISDGRIVMPLSYLNRIGEKAVQEIELRQPFRSLRDFLDRTDRRIVNKGVMLNLLWSDVFQDIGGEKTTKQLISEYYFYMATGKSRGEMTKLLEEYNKEIEPLNRFDLIKKKTESCPIFEIDYQEYFKEYFGADTVSLSKVIKLEQEYELTTAGVIGGIKVIKTKTNKTMAFASLSNSNCSIDLVLFPKTYAEYETKIKDDVLSEVKGKYSIKNNKRSIIVNSLRMIEV